MVTAIGDQTSAKQRRKLRWTKNLTDQLTFLGWSPKRFVHELNEAGCDVTRQAVDQWLSGETSPSPENQAYVIKVTRAPGLFSIEAP